MPVYHVYFMVDGPPETNMRDQGGRVVDRFAAIIHIICIWCHISALLPCQLSLPLGLVVLVSLSWCVMTALSAKFGDANNGVVRAGVLAEFEFVPQIVCCSVHVSSRVTLYDSTTLPSYCNTNVLCVFFFIMATTSTVPPLSW